MHRNQNSPFADPILIPLRLILRNPHPNKTPHNPSSRSTDSRATQSSHNWSRRNQRSDTRNRQHPHPRQPAQCSTDNPPCSHSSDCTLRSLRPLLVCKHPRATLVRQQHRYIIIAEPRTSQLINNIDRLPFIHRETKN